MYIRKLSVITGIAILSLSFLVSCSQPAKDITYTTSSLDAKNYFMDGLAANDDLQADKARELFAKARQADPEFAMAFYYGALTATSPAEFNDLLGNAVELAPKASEPEQLVIASLDATDNDEAELAREKLTQLVTMLPEGKRAHFILGNFYFGQQQWPLAEVQYQLVNKLDPYFAAAYNNLAYVYSNQGKYDESIEALKKYAELRPEDPNVHDSMGEIYLRSQDYEKSVEEYSTALKLMPDFIFSMVGLGNNAVFVGDYEKGRAEYGEIFKHAHSIADTNIAYFWIAVSYIYEGKPKSALNTLQEQLKLAESHGNINNQAIIHGQMAAINREKGDYTAALREAASERQFASDPDVQPGPREALIRDACFTEAIVFTHLDNEQMADNSLSEFQQSAQDSKDPVAMGAYHALKGIVLYWRQDYINAIEELGQADPLDQYAKFYLGLCYHETGLEDKANSIFAEIAINNRNSLGYSFVRSEAIRRSNETES